MSRFLVRLAALLLRLAVRTLRVRIAYDDGHSTRAAEHAFGSEIYAVRERDLIALSCITRFARFQTLVAKGRDGDWATIAAETLGCAVVRGSSRHEPAGAAMALIRALRSSTRPAFVVVDGPVGPSGVAKPGIGALASQTGRAVIPVVARVRGKIVLRSSWSKMIVPIPFSAVTIALGSPRTLPPGATREQIDALADSVSAFFLSAEPDSSSHRATRAPCPAEGATR